jgi:high affinity Mn2+ porin
VRLIPAAFLIPFMSQLLTSQQVKSQQETPLRAGEIPREEETRQSQKPEPEERWNLFYQATSIGQYHGTFRSPYQGPNSLQPQPEAHVSLTTTFFFGYRLARNTQLYFDPEMAGGKGFSDVTGIANFTNGEIPRVATATPKPYIARLYITQDFGFGTGKERFESAENQLAAERPMQRYSITMGRFTITDFFDNNRYSHEPRTQFIGWSVMYNGAWDYPADVRGYTWGWVHELHLRRWSLRYGSAAMPRTANGPRFDRRLLVNQGNVFEGESRYEIGRHPGASRLLYYFNHANAGTYADAIRLADRTGTTPDVTATRRNGTLKYGAGLNVEQEITKNIGVFGRLGWNDGKTESFAFTAIDRMANVGISITGERWRRKEDTIGSAFTMSGLSGVHAVYLARGGLDFIIGDGKLRYGHEGVWETYYSARIWKPFFVSIFAQWIANPAYNRDRGPVWVGSIRLHLELNIETLASRFHR